MLSNLVLVAVVVAIAVLYWSTRAGKTAPAEAKQLVADGARLVDVRTPGEFGSGHIHGAMNVPLQALANRIAELGDRSQPVVVYCRSGARSSSAKKVLEKAGFEKVFDLGAMSRWSH